MDGGVGAIFSAINAAFNFAIVISQLQDVPEEARRFSSLINRVRLDYNESIRLLGHPIVEKRLASDDLERSYIHGTITSTKHALADIGRFVEKIRVQDNGGSGGVSYGRRCEWLWRYRSKVDSSERLLDTAHKSLMGAMQRMVMWIGPGPSLAPTVVLTPVSNMLGFNNPADAALTSPSMVSLPPPYQEEARMRDDNELDDGLVTARRRLTKYDGSRRERSKSNVSINVVPREFTKRFDDGNQN